MRAPAAQAMQDQHYPQFESLLRATFSLYAGRKIASETIRAYWMYLGPKMDLQDLPGALRSACAESPTFPPSALQIADCATRARGHEHMRKQAEDALKAVGNGRKMLADRSEDLRHERNVKEISKVLSMLSGKLSV